MSNANMLTHHTHHLQSQMQTKIKLICSLVSPDRTGHARWCSLSTLVQRNLVCKLIWCIRLITNEMPRSRMIDRLMWNDRLRRTVNRRWTFLCNRSIKENHRMIQSVIRYITVRNTWQFWSLCNVTCRNKTLSGFFSLLNAFKPVTARV